MGVVSLLDEEVIPFTIAGVEAGRDTHLHRFMTKPVGRGEKKEIPTATAYKEITKLGFVLAVYEEREKSVRTQIEAFGKTLQAQPIIDEELLNEVVNLNEFPIGIVGDFSPDYLILPKEVIITVCKVHQRYFNFERDGELIPKFLAFSNTAVKDKNILKEGYEKVLKARLEDALFFYKEDLKHKLEDFYPQLAGIQFHQKLGTMLDKVERNGGIALLLNRETGIGEKGKIERANKLSKCDLLTEMVKEFDELQGIIGRHYALKQGEDPEVAEAIYEHYLPKTAEDSLPQTETGFILALADKLDTLISFISIGEKPKGTSDPFGIRRNAIGIVRLIVEKGLDIDLKSLLKEISETAQREKILHIAQTTENWKEVFEKEIIPQVIEFINGRFVGYMKEKGYKTDIINAVVSTEDTNLYRNYLKIDSLQKLQEDKSFNEIMTVFKRVGRIIPEGFEGEVDESLLSQQEEKELYQVFNQIKSQFEGLIKDKKYQEALGKLVELKPYIDRFFDNVMVMVEDEKLKNNRLALMKTINREFKKIADFTKITT